MSVESLPGEEWRQTYHANYFVSNLGRVKSMARDKTGRLLTLQYKSNFGYPAVMFWTDYGFKRHSVHRLVAVAFLGPIPEGLFVLHKDDDPKNARADNLEFGTPLKNVHDMIARGRQRVAFGAQRATTKLKESDIPEIRRRLTVGEARWRIGRDYGVTYSCIRRIAEGSAWWYVK